MDTTKVFWSGNSQSIRLPKKYRFDPRVKKISIHREGTRLILEPLYSEDWPDDFWLAFGDMPDDFERPESVPVKREDVEF